MVKAKRKYSSVIAFASVILAVAVIGFAVHTRTESFSKLLSLNIEGESPRALRLWDDGDGTVYAFLPSYAELDKVFFSPAVRLTVDGSLISDGQSLSGLEPGNKYQLESSTLFGSRKSAFVIMRSANTAAMYIDTADGSMASVREDINHTEPIRLTLLRPDGCLDYACSGGDYIKGRGNSTWELDKKPYNITLEAPAGLLGMNKGRTWVLLANGYDETNIRNKLALDLARDIMPRWSPDSEYVDLYLNGEYEGLYLLCEKIEVSENRISNTAGENCYLLEATSEYKCDLNKPHISFAPSRIFQVCYPEVCSDSQLDMLADASLALNDAIIGGDASGLSMLDWDSWALKIAFDEAVLCMDTDNFSVFYIYDASTGLFTVGPFWDYDLSLGNDGSKYTETSKFPDQLYCTFKPWYGRLYECPEFYERIKSVYVSVVLPHLEDMRKTALPDLIESTALSGEMNSIRWNSMFKLSYKQDASLTDRLDRLEKFIDERLAFLDFTWVQGKEMRSVYLNYPSETEFNTILDVLCVEAGGCIPPRDLLSAVNGDESISWYNETLGEDFDVTRPIWENTVLLAVSDDAQPVQAQAGNGVPSLSQSVQRFREYVSLRWFSLTLLLTLGITGIITAVLLFADIKRRRIKVKGKNHDR